MNVETAINDLGVNAVQAVTMMDLLGITPDDFINPTRFARFQVVVDYLKQFPDDTQRFLITKATRGKMVDRLDHIFEYTNLLKQKFAQEETLDSIKKELSVLEATGDPKIELTRHQKDEMDRQIDLITQEISIYER